MGTSRTVKMKDRIFLAQQQKLKILNTYVHPHALPLSIYWIAFGSTGCNGLARHQVLILFSSPLEASEFFPNLLAHKLWSYCIVSCSCFSSSLLLFYKDEECFMVGFLSPSNGGGTYLNRDLDLAITYSSVRLSPSMEMTLKCSYHYQSVCLGTDSKTLSV